MIPNQPRGQCFDLRCGERLASGGFALVIRIASHDIRCDDPGAILDLTSYDGIKGVIHCPSKRPTRMLCDASFLRFYHTALITEANVRESIVNPQTQGPEGSEGSQSTSMGSYSMGRREYRPTHMQIPSISDPDGVTSLL